MVDGYIQRMTWISEYVGQLEACLLDAFGKSCQYGRQPGATASLDGCGCDDECGQWYVTVKQMYPFETFGVPTTSGACGTSLMADLVVGKVRCIEVPEEGEPPEHDVMVQAFDDQMADALALYDLIVCCSPGKRFEVVAGIWTPYGPEGACVGGEWAVQVAVK